MCLSCFRRRAGYNDVAYQHDNFYYYICPHVGAALLPCACVGFTFVMRSAEASGVRPAVVPAATVSSIAKHDTVRPPEDTRAIQGH